MTALRPHVAVVILNYNGWQDTLDCVASLLASTVSCKISIVVADNGSKPDALNSLSQGLGEHQKAGVAYQMLSRHEVQATPAASSEDAVELVLIRNDANLGFAGGCNPGIQWAMHAGADYVWLLNNDTEVEPQALEALINRCRAHPHIGICGSKLVYFDDRRTLQARGGAVYEPNKANGRHLGVGESVDAPENVEDIEARMDYVIGASMMVTRSFIEKVGLMTEDYLLYFEELDWATRGKQLGLKLGYAADSVVFHKEGATIGSSHRKYSSPLSQRFLCRNRLLFTRRFFPQFLNRVRLQFLLEICVWLARGVPGHAWIVLGALLGLRVSLPK